jgi:predicted metal-dependent RNase
VPTLQLVISDKLLGYGSDPISGQQITHTFIDNGTYNAILTSNSKFKIFVG